MNDIALLAGVIPYVIAAGAIVVLVLDVVRRYMVISSALTPVLAFIFGIVSVGLIMAMNVQPFNVQTVATAILAGLIAGFEAIVIKEVGRSADDRQMIMRAGVNPSTAEVEQTIVRAETPPPTHDI